MVGRREAVPKRLWRVWGGDTRLVGEDWADSGNMVENQGSGDVDKGCRD